MLSPTSIITAVAATLFVTWAWQRTISRRRFQGLPRVGIDPGLFGLRLQAAKNEFFSDGQKLLERGYKQVCSTYPVEFDIFLSSGFDKKKHDSINLLRILYRPVTASDSSSLMFSLTNSKTSQTPKSVSRRSFLSVSWGNTPNSILCEARLSTET